jgi:hypothetical protein
VERRFVSIADPSRVTVGELRRAADRVGADLAVVVQEDRPIVTVRRGDLVDADANDAIAAHLGRLTELEDAPLGDVAAGARVAAESDFALVGAVDSLGRPPLQRSAHTQQPARASCTAL